jgi:hypothetical protein
VPVLETGGGRFAELGEQLERFGVIATCGRRVAEEAIARAESRQHAALAGSVFLAAKQVERTLIVPA